MLAAFGRIGAAVARVLPSAMKVAGKIKGVGSALANVASKNRGMMNMITSGIKKIGPKATRIMRSVNRINNKYGKFAPAFANMIGNIANPEGMGAGPDPTQTYGSY